MLATSDRGDVAARGEPPRRVRRARSERQPRRRVPAGGGDPRRRHRGRGRRPRRGDRRPGEAGIAARRGRGSRRGSARIVVNGCRDRLRARRRQPRRRARRGGRLAGPAAGSSTGDASIGVASRDAIGRALAVLEPDELIVIVLRFYLDLSVEAIAEPVGHPGRDGQVPAPPRDAAPPRRPRSQRVTTDERRPLRHTRSRPRSTTREPGGRCRRRSGHACAAIPVDARELAGRASARSSAAVCALAADRPLAIALLRRGRRLRPRSRGFVRPGHRSAGHGRRRPVRDRRGRAVLGRRPSPTQSVALMRFSARPASKRLSSPSASTPTASSPRRMGFPELYDRDQSDGRDIVEVVGVDPRGTISLLS